MSRPLTAVLPRLVVFLLLVAPLACGQRTTTFKPVIEDGQCQVIPEFSARSDWIVHDLWVETEFDSDFNGKKDRVHVSVTRPKQTEQPGFRLPVIYETSPYFAGVAQLDRSKFWNPRQEVGAEPPTRPSMAPVNTRGNLRPSQSRSLKRQWVRRGFVVVHSSSPGTGLSQGCPTVGGENEALAPKAVIDWLNGRAKGYTEPDGDEEVLATWSTGKVGMIGTSYNGTLPLAAATTGVDGLEAIIPVAPNTSYYHYYRSHGLVVHPFGYMGEDIDVLYEFINSGDRAMRGVCDEKVRDDLLQAKFDRKTGDWNAFWAGRDYLLQLDKLKAAVLMAHAFNDWNVMPEHSVRIYEALKKKGVPTQAFFHQGGHGGDPPMRMVNRWFTRYLWGIQNGVEKDQRSWVVREGDNRQSPTGYPEYPHPDASMVVLRPGTGGLERGTLVASDKGTAAKETLIDNVAFSGKELASADQSDHRLLYATAELKAPVHISGTAKMKLRLASNRPAANLSVWIVSLPWEPTRQLNDNRNVITRGWMDPQNHSSIEKGEPLEKGRFYDLEFTLQPDDQIIPAGQRIGLMVFSSDRDFTLWPEPGTELTLDLEHAALELPIVGGAKAFSAATR